jgi:hypothetical protein
MNNANWNPQLHYLFRTSHHWSPIISQIYLVHNVSLYFFKSHFNIVACHSVSRVFRLVIGFIGYIQVVTTNNYADLHNLQSLHTNLFSLSVLVLTDLWHRDYKSLTKSHSQYHCATAYVKSSNLHWLTSCTLLHLRTSPVAISYRELTRLLNRTNSVT